MKQAEAIDRNNPLVLFLKGRITKNLEQKRKLLWRCLGSPGKRLWEFGALNALRSHANGDQEELQRIRDWARRAKAIVGDTPRAKAYGF